MKKSVIGVVETRQEAENIVRSARDAGFFLNDISVLFPDQTTTKDFAHELNTKAPEGAVAGGSAGGVVGGTIGLLAGLGAIAIPGLGPFVAAGPLMAALSGAAAGVTVGGVAGALVGFGIPEYEAKRYEGKVRGGNILVAIHVDNEEMKKSAENLLKSFNAHNVASKNESALPTEARK
ncbi:MAG TPA: DUF3341 domain-containing protein [Polyangiaceae bacterium]